MMPRTNTPDNKRRHATYRRLVERFGFICGPLNLAEAVLLYRG
jgi:hypothetical protein